jgi:hypothetical protein
MVINKPKGHTESERYLNRVCNDTFLSLWTYPSPTNADGKELCDLLVVFRSSVIIFSDKDCVFQDDGNMETAWDRWYKKAIVKSVSQLYGAEREIIRNPDKIFLDSKKQTPFPLIIPPREEIRVYRMAVARGARDACIKFYGGGSGSLMMLHSSDKVVLKPFTICSRVFIDEGKWEEFRTKFQNGYQVPENEISYIWDIIIERFAHHVMSGTSRVLSHPDVASQSRIFSYLANESRLRRRQLARALVGIISKPLPKN